MEDNVIKEEILSILNKNDWSMKIKELMNISSESEIEIEVKSITQADSNDFILVKLLVNGQGNLFAFDLNYNQSDNIVEVIATEDITETEIRNNKTSFDISYWSYNITYSQLSNMYEKKIIKVPDMQRGFVWSKLQASRLIESILMGLPLPSIFLVQIEEDGRKKYLVIDGLQRITAIYSFIKNRRLPNSTLKNNAGFALSGVNQKFNGKTFDELDSEGLADNLELNTINVIEFKQSSPYTESAIYQVFERLNSGGTSLTSQQIRNSIYYGYFNKKLNQFSEKYISQYFSQSANLNLMNSELVLRTISIFDLIRNDGGIDAFSTVGSIVYKNLLNDTAEKYHIEYKKSEIREMPREYEEKIDNLFNDLLISLTLAKKILEDDAFKRYIGKTDNFTTRISPILFETIIVTLMLNLNKYSEEELLSKKERIRTKYKELFINKSEGQNSDFELFFTQGTGKRDNISNRITTMQKVFFND